MDSPDLRPRHLRSAALGLLAGAMLSAAHAPLGCDWTELAVAAPWRKVLYTGVGAATLLAVSNRGSVAFGARFSMAAGLVGAALGVAAHTLWIESVFNARGYLALAAAVVLTLTGAHLLAPLPRERGELRRRPLRTRTGLAIVGAALGAQLLSLGAPLAALGRGTELDTRLAQFAFLSLTAIGAVAFGPLVRSFRAAPAILLAAAVFAGFEALRGIEAFADRDGIQRFLSSAPWRLDLTHFGRLDGALLIAARVLVAPTFLLGAGLESLREPLDRRRVLFGALFGALATAALYPVVRSDGAPELEHWPAVEIWRWSSGIAACGAAFAIAGLRELRGLRTPGVVASLVGGAACVFAPAPRAWPFAPLEGASTRIEWCSASATSTAAVLTLADDSRVLWIDGRRITPTRGDARIEMRLFATEQPARRVLLLGPLTPERRAAFVGATIDRCTPFTSDLETIEAALGVVDAGAGRVRSASQVRRSARLGEYDLIVAPPVDDADPWFVMPRLSEDTHFTAWLDPRAPIADDRWSSRVDVALISLDRWYVGVGDRGAARSGPRSDTLSGWRRATTWRNDLQRLDATFVAARLAMANLDEPLGRVFAGLEIHCEAQAESSAFEERELGIRFSDDALDFWLQDALTRAPDPFTRELWNEVARVLVIQRDVARIDRWIEPVATAHAPWPELEGALAHADLEMLEPSKAATRLNRALRAAPNDFELRRLRGHALLAIGDAAGAALELERALTLAPQRQDIARQLAIARIRSGDPRGRAEIDRQLAEHPDDPELAPYRGDGPYPPIDPRYRPRSSFDE